MDAPAGYQSAVAEKAKILFIINSPIVGGAERHTYDLAQKLNRQGFAARIFSMKDGPAFAGGEVPFLRARAGTSLFQRIRELRAEIARGADLIVGVNERPMLAAFLARLSRGGGKPPVVGILHTTVLLSRRQEILFRLHFPILAALDGFVFISANQRRFWADKGLKPRRATTILNGVDTDHFSPARRDRLRAKSRAELGYGEDDVVFALCAVFRLEKNHLQFIDAIAQLRQEGLPARGLLIGDGALREAIEGRIAALSLQDAVRITGFQKDVTPFVAAADVGVNCSTAIETLSLSALETLAMGLPMVMSDIGGASEIVDGTDGLLFPAGDAAALKASLQSFFNRDIREKAGQAARNIVEKHFDHHAMVESYANYFAEIIHEASSSAAMTE
jgi:L-malate glycosyltransferase